MPSFKLHLRDYYVKSDGRAPVYIIATNRKPYYINLKVYCKPEEWNKRNNEPKDASLRLYCRAKLQDVERAFLDKGFNVEMFKRIVSGETSSNVASFIEGLNESNKRTRDGYFVALRSLKSFKGSDIYFEDIDAAFVMNYRSWAKGRGLSLNSQSNYLRAVRSVWNKAAAQGVVSGNPFKGLVPRGTRTKKRAADIVATRKLVSLSGKYRDIYVLMLLLGGIDYLDLFHAPEPSGGYLDYTRVKLGQKGQPIRIAILPEAREIIDRYKGNGKLLNFSEGINTIEGYRSQLRRVNYNLKKLCVENGLEPLTTKTARHTFATLCRDIGIPLDVTKQFLGHEDNSVTAIYIKEHPQEVMDEWLRKFADFIFLGFE